MTANVIRRAVRSEPGNDTAIVEVRAMKRIRIEKPKPRRPMEIELPHPLDPRDPDIVRVKRGPVWRFADRRWAV